MFDLLARLRDQDSGEILFDGVDSRTLTRDSLLRNMAYVGQEPFLFNTTVENNIRGAETSVTDEQIVEAAKAAAAAKAAPAVSYNAGGMFEGDDDDEFRGHGIADKGKGGSEKEAETGGGALEAPRGRNSQKGADSTQAPAGKAAGMSRNQAGIAPL